MSVFRKRKHIVHPSFHLFSPPNSFLFHFRQIHNIAVQILQEMKHFLHFIWVFRLNQFFQQNMPIYLSVLYQPSQIETVLFWPGQYWFSEPDTQPLIVFADSHQLYPGFSTIFW
jgi:hypothetical protein